MEWKKFLIGSGGVWIFLIGCIVALLIFLASRKKQAPETTVFMHRTTAESIIRRTLRNRSNLSELAIERLLAVARHETGGFTSAIFRENSNPWGMKLARRRTTTAIGENRGHARYNSLEDGVIDMLHYLISFRTNPGDFQNLESFAAELKADGYYEDTLENYTAGLRRWYRGINLSTNIIELKQWKTPVTLK